MAVGYELFLRGDPGLALSADDLARAVATLPEGVRAEPFTGAADAPAVPRGVDLELEAGAPIGHLLDAAFAVAAELSLEVFDPQSGSAVTAAQRELIAARYAELCAYRADTLGEIGVTPLGPGPVASRTGLHLWLIVAGIIVAFLLLARGCRWLV